MGSRCKINMGCGPRNFGEDWIHIDGGDYPHLDYRDITKLEFEDESVDLIYASHVIQYFDRDEVRKVLSEWKRVLKKGGVLRIAVPSFTNIVFQYFIKGVHLGKFLGLLYGKMKMGDKWIYHKTTYDFNGLYHVLIQAGFHAPCGWNWRETEHAQFDDHSQAYIPHMDKDNGTLISLNMEAIK